MLKRNKRIIAILLSHLLIIVEVANTVPIQALAFTQSKPILNIPDVDTNASVVEEDENATLSTDKKDTVNYVGKTSPIEGTIAGTITIPGVGSGSINADINMNPIDINISKEKNEATVYSMVVNNIFNSNGTYLNIPRELLSSNLLKEIDKADIVDWRNFEDNNSSTITYNPLMSDEYKRALSWLSDNNVIHPFPEYTLSKDGNTIKQVTSLITSPYQKYSIVNGEMKSANINKADFIMTLMKAVDGVQWSRPMAIKSEEQNVAQTEPILDSMYRKDFLTTIGNLDVSENTVTLDRSKYQMQSIYMNPNVYELYFTAAINNGILDITDFSEKNQFIYDYIGWQTFRLQANSDGSLKDNGLSNKDTSTSYSKAYPRWLVRNQLIRLDSSNPSSTKINYVPGSKPFGESYTYGTNNIYLGPVKDQSKLAKNNEPNIITQYLEFSSADKSYGSKYKDLINQLPALYRLTQEDKSTFDTNSMRELSIKYNPELANTYFNINELTYMDAFKIIYKALKRYDSVNLTNLETEIITSKFGLRFRDLADEDKTIINYLIAKGVINPEEYDSYIVDSILTQEDAYILLYRLCNKDARYKTDFTVTQAELNMVRQGYVQTNVKLYEVPTNTTDVSIQIDSDIDNVDANGYFPLYITTESSDKVKGYLTDKANKKINIEYIPITTSNKNNFIAFLVPNSYLNQDLRLTIEGSTSKILTGIRGCGIYTIPNSNSDTNKLDKYSLIADSTSPSKVIDIRNHILQNNVSSDNIGSPGDDIEEDDNSVDVVQNTGAIFTNGLKVYKYSNGVSTNCTASSIADTSSDNYIAFIGDISNIKELRNGDTVIEAKKVFYKDDNRVYFNVNGDISNMNISLVMNDETIIPFNHTSLYYTVSDNAVTPVNIVNYYNYASDISESNMESYLKEAYKSIVKMDDTFKGIEIKYILNTKYNFSTLQESSLKFKTSLIDIFSFMPKLNSTSISSTFTNSKPTAPKINTSVTLGFNRSSLDSYRYQDTKIFIDSKINPEFKSDLSKLVSDITISDGDTLSGSTSQIQLSFKTKQRTASALLSTLMNKISIAGDLKTESKVAFVSIMAGEEDNRKGVLIPESELGKYNIEVITDEAGNKNTLRNKATGVTAYLNQALKKAIIGNEIHNYSGSALLYSVTENINYYNLSVIAELMAIDSLSSSVTSEGIIVPYKNSGYTGKLTTTLVGSSLATYNQDNTDSTEYTILNDSVVLGGSKYVENGRKTQIITTSDGVYADLTTTSDSSNGYMISRNPFTDIRRLVVGYELDKLIAVSADTSTNITSTLDGYINDIKKTPVRTLKSDAAIQRAKDNLVINNTIAHAYIQPEASWSINPLTTEYMTKPVINIIAYPGVSVDKVYENFIKFLVKYHNQERHYTFLGKDMKIPVSGDITAWYKSKIKLDDPTSQIKINIIKTTYKDGVVPSNSDVASLISTDKKWLVTSSGNTMLKVGTKFTDTNGISELGFKISYISNKVYITNPYIYAGLPVNAIPLEDIAPGTSVTLPSGARYLTIDPISTINYRGNLNILYSDMAVSLVSSKLTKATKIVFGMDEIDIWNDFYKGLKDQSYKDAAGINSNYISEPWKTDLGTDKNSLSDKELAYRQNLSLINEAYAVGNSLNFIVKTDTDKVNLTGPIAYPFMKNKTDMNEITYLYSKTPVTTFSSDYVTFDGKQKSATKLDKIDNNVILVARPTLRFKYGTMIVDAFSNNKTTDGSYTAKAFNSGSRYVQKQYIDSPLSELRNYLFNEAANVTYIKDLQQGSRISTNAGIFIKADSHSADSTEYVTFIAAEPQEIKGDTLRNSLTPVALKTAKLLASTQLNGDLGLKVPLLNLADLNSFVPPTKKELESVLNYVEKSKKDYTTIYVEDYSSNEVTLKVGNISGGSLTEIAEPSSNVRTYPRFDLNPYLKVIKVGDDKSQDYQILGYENKGSHAADYSLNNYAFLFKLQEDITEPLTIWEEFTGLELSNLRIKDRSLYDPLFQENLLAVESNSSIMRAESIGYKIKVVMYALIICYIICMLAMLPLTTIPSIRNALRSRGGRLFVKVASLGRVSNVDEIVFKDYYPQLLLVLFITLMIFNTSFNLSFLTTFGDIAFKIVNVVYENVKIVFTSIYS